MLEAIDDQIAQDKKELGTRTPVRKLRQRADHKEVWFI